jgi:hypothetical protein
VLASFYIFWHGNIFKEEALVIYFVLVFFFLPLTTFTFLWPLWNFHREMGAYKEQVETEFAQRMTDCDRQMRAYLRGELDIEQAQSARETLAVLEALHPEQVHYPVWPFRNDMWVRLYLPQILGLAGGALSQLIADWLLR